MLKKDGYYVFDSFAKIDGLIYGFSTTALGSMRTKPKKIADLALFMQALNISEKDVVGMNQVHKDAVVWVDAKDKGLVIQETDGLLSEEKDIFLSGTFADCVPVLLYDTKKQTVGIIHAGWRGVVANIVGVAIEKMLENGSDRDDIMVGLGPSIRDCCYAIPDARASQIREAFPKWQYEILDPRDGKTYFSMQNTIILQLLAIGIQEDTIEDGCVCTYEKEDFYSFRRTENKENFPLFAGVIGRA